VDDLAGEERVAFIDAGIQYRDVLPGAAKAQAPGVRRADERPAIAERWPMQAIFMHRYDVRVICRGTHCSLVEFRCDESTEMRVLAHLHELAGKITQCALDWGAAHRPAHFENGARAPMLARMLGELFHARFARLPV
jgi:hypothetical protein